MPLAACSLKVQVGRRGVIRFEGAAGADMASGGSFGVISGNG